MSAVLSIVRISPKMWGIAGTGIMVLFMTVRGIAGIVVSGVWMRGIANIVTDMNMIPRLLILSTSSFTYHTISMWEYNYNFRFTLIYELWQSNKILPIIYRAITSLTHLFSLLNNYLYLFTYVLTLFLHRV